MGISLDRPFKIAFIGTHGVGKTTLCFGLAARLKARDVALDVVHEVARRCPLPINRDTGLAAQSWILHRQISEELVASSQYPVVICDRSVLDNYVYLLLVAGPQGALDALVEEWVESYDMLVHVPALEAPASDGVRSADPAFQRLVEQRLEREMEERELEVLRLRGRQRESWLPTVEIEVMQRLNPSQLALL